MNSSHQATYFEYIGLLSFLSCLIRNSLQKEDALYFYVDASKGFTLWMPVFKVLGFDIDENKIETLSKGESYLEHISSQSIFDCIESGHLEATSDFKRISEVDGIILCVPTPLNRHLEPDLSYVESTLNQIVPFLKKGQLISLESTTYPGTTTEIVQPIIESRVG